MSMSTSSSRKEKRKAIKKMKRKQMRKEMAERERQEEEAVLNDPEELQRLHLLELEEAQRMERGRNEFLQRERAYQEEQQLLLEKEKEEKLLLQQSQSQSQSQSEEEEAKGNNDDNEEEELLPEIIWQGNEIIFKKKKKLRVPNHQHKTLIHNEQPLQDAADTRPSSNPLPPESHILENVAQQVPNFGTEQDKSHCPFHLKTGACRFGQRCSRVHFYPDKSCTLLIKNMYNGPGLAWEPARALRNDVHSIFRGFGDENEDFMQICIGLEEYMVGVER